MDQKLKLNNGKTLYYHVHLSTALRRPHYEWYEWKVTLKYEGRQFTTLMGTTDCAPIPLESCIKKILLDCSNYKAYSSVANDILKSIGKGITYKVYDNLSPMEMVETLYRHYGKTLDGIRRVFGSDVTFKELLP